jgi:hypothetical protein
MSEILNNKVADSGLISIDLASFIPANEIVLFDIKPFLFMELILKEKDFRVAIQHVNWAAFENKIVGIYCSTDAIIPMWANMLIASSLTPIAESVYFGEVNKVREQVLLNNIAKLNIADYIDQRVVIKGCGETPISESAYVAITHKLRPVVKSIMYGEPCSTVPVYKKKS